MGKGGFPGGSVVKNLPASAGDVKRHRFDFWVGKIPWSRKWQPTLVFLPEKFHGQRNLVDYSPWGHKKWDTTEWLSTAQHKHRKILSSLHLCMHTCSVVSNSLWPHGLCSPPVSSVHGDSPGKNTRVGCHVLLQGIFSTQESNQHLFHLLHWEAGSLPLVPLGMPQVYLYLKKKLDSIYAWYYDICFYLIYFI